MHLCIYLDLLVSKNMSQYLTNKTHYSSVAHSVKGTLVLEEGLQQQNSCVCSQGTWAISHHQSGEISFLTQ